MNTTTAIRQLERRRRMTAFSYVDLAMETGIPRERLSHILCGPSDDDVLAIGRAITQREHQITGTR